MEGIGPTGRVTSSTGDVDREGEIVSRYSGPVTRPIALLVPLDEDLVGLAISAGTETEALAQLAGVRRMLRMPA